MNELTISGAQFRDMIVVGAAMLERNRQAIDALNVFPVPDGDTGTNMTMTMQSAVKELRSLPADADVSAVADALSMGALRGARGNSGVILSQLFRGFSRAFKGASVMDAQLLSSALTMGCEAAYKAVMKPKEGTILTVSRMIAEEAAELASRGANVYRLVDAVIESGERALAKTPDLLPVLKEAGVIDSGGKGLLTIYRGFKLSLDGDEIPDLPEQAELETPPSSAAAELEGVPEESIEFGYCTEFFVVHLNPAFQESDLDVFRDHLMRLGDSVVVAYDADIVKVHVHSNAPGKVLQMALRLGELDHLKIENMREQNRALQAERKRNEKEYAMVAVSAGDGIESVFRELMVDHVIAGGQTMNPSIDAIASAIRKVNARNVFVLPNNGNIIMAAQQAAEIVSCNVIVLPTKTIPQGIAAAMAFNGSVDAECNEKAMTAAFGEVVSGAVTYAVRDTKFRGESISQGDILGMMDNELCCVGTAVDAVATDLLRRMMEKRGEPDAAVTIFYGENVDEANAEALLAQLETEYPEAEFIVQRGGQPLYYYYLSVE